MRLTETSYYESLLPEVIVVSEPLSIEGKSSLMEGCGIAAYWLTDTTLDQIKQNGLNFFQGAIRSRTNKGNDNKNPNFYPAWRETPHSRKGGMLPTGYICAKNFYKEWGMRLKSEMKISGSYYTENETRGNESEIWVFPKYKIVVLSYNG